MKQVLDVRIGKKEYELDGGYRSVETDSCIRFMSMCSESSQMESEYCFWQMERYPQKLIVNKCIKFDKMSAVNSQCWQVCDDKRDLK